MKNKNWSKILKLCLIKAFIWLFVLFQLNSCATTSSDDPYLIMGSSPRSNERVIDKITIDHGDPYERLYTNTNDPPTLASQNIGGRIFRNVPMLERLLSEAQQKFPNQNIDIRNAKLEFKYISRRREYLGAPVNDFANYVTWQRQYTADVVIIE